VACGLEGTIFQLEQNEKDKNPHFNLYGKENGQLILMTKDHIMPKSLGGKSENSNYHTCCRICNNLKGNEILRPEDVCELRLFYDKNRGLTKKKLNTLLKEKTKKLFENNLDKM
jgi:5-methylcytosine-specific restriction endonuclease McrA